MTRAVKLLKQKVNLGSGFAFNDIRNPQSETIPPIAIRRKYSYRSDNIVEGFPLLACPSRFRECMEMNLFLMHRYTGKYSTQRNKKSESDNVLSAGYLASMGGAELDVSTVLTQAKDLREFLIWLEEDGSNYEEVVASPLSRDSSEEDVKNLPIWRYHEYLCQKVKNKNKKTRLSFKVAQNRISVVKHFYLWTYKRGKIDSIPFSLEFKKLRYSSSSQSVEDTLYSLPTLQSDKGGHYQWVSNLKIPRKIKQKEDTPKEKLQPYSQAELVTLLSTKIAKHRTFGLMLKCAYLAGFRAFEIIAIDYNDTFDPNLEQNKNRKLHIPIVRKGHKPINIIVTKNLMTLLHNYTLDDVWLKRRGKHETKYGMNNPENPLPLFINSSGKRMSESTPTNIISQVRKELKNKGETRLQRDFHDLRSTYGTYLAIYLIKKGESPKEVRLFLRKLLSHESFTVTERYIDFAKATDLDEFGSMSTWVQDIYNDVHKQIEEKDAA